MYNLTGACMSLKLTGIEEAFEKTGLLQMGNWVNSINNNSPVFVIKTDQYLLIRFWVGGWSKIKAASLLFYSNL